MCDVVHVGAGGAAKLAAEVAAVAPWACEGCLASNSHEVIRCTVCTVWRSAWHMSQWKEEQARAREAEATAAAAAEAERAAAAAAAAKVLVGATLGRLRCAAGAHTLQRPAASLLARPLSLSLSLPPVSEQLALRCGGGPHCNGHAQNGYGALAAAHVRRHRWLAQCFDDWATVVLGSAAYQARTASRLKAAGLIEVKLDTLHSYACVLHLGLRLHHHLLAVLASFCCSVLVLLLLPLLRLCLLLVPVLPQQLLPAVPNQADLVTTSRCNQIQLSAATPPALSTDRPPQR